MVEELRPLAICVTANCSGVTHSQLSGNSFQVPTHYSCTGPTTLLRSQETECLFDGANLAIGAWVEPPTLYALHSTLFRLEFVSLLKLSNQTGGEQSLALCLSVSALFTWASSVVTLSSYITTIFQLVNT